MPNLQLIVSIIKYLKEEGQQSFVSADTKESLEVAVQCLQTAYDINSSDCESPQNVVPLSLEDIFERARLSYEANITSSDAVKRAELMKDLGNDRMKNNQFHDAVEYYTACIHLDPKNAIYFGNRAAAHSKLGHTEKAIEDCKYAIEIDPKYAKAYGRLGVAYASMELHDQAIKAFNKAVELDPTNESYQSNLKIAQEKKDKPTNNVPQGGGVVGRLNSVEWETLFTNSAFRNMASSLMQDPNIISALSASMASSLNQGSSPPPPPPAASSSSNNEGSSDSSGGPGPNILGGGRNLDVLLEAGQYLAAQMQAANPDLVEQFRQATSRTFNRQNPDNRDSSSQ